MIIFEGKGVPLKHWLKIHNRSVRRHIYWAKASIGQILFPGSYARSRQIAKSYRRRRTIYRSFGIDLCRNRSWTFITGPSQIMDVYSWFLISNKYFHARLHFVARYFQARFVKESDRRITVLRLLLIFTLEKKGIRADINRYLDFSILARGRSRERRGAKELSSKEGIPDATLDASSYRFVEHRRRWDKKVSPPFRGVYNTIISRGWSLARMSPLAREWTGVARGATADVAQLDIALSRRDVIENHFTSSTETSRSRCPVRT